MWTYVGAVALLVGYFVTRGLLRDPQFDTISALADPFGLSPLALATKYWTAADRNTMLVPLTGMLLVNRAAMGRRRSRGVCYHLRAVPLRRTRRSTERAQESRNR